MRIKRNEYCCSRWKSIYNFCGTFQIVPSEDSLSEDLNPKDDNDTTSNNNCRFKIFIPKIEGSNPQFITDIKTFIGGLPFYNSDHNKCFP